MAIGIALVRVLTADLAALLVDRAPANVTRTAPSMAARFDRIEAQLAALIHARRNDRRAAHKAGTQVRRSG
jgi:hypothetical protein